MKTAREERYSDLLWDIYERHGRKGLHRLCVLVELLDEEIKFNVKLTWDEHKTKHDVDKTKKRSKQKS